MSGMSAYAAFGVLLSLLGGAGMARLFIPVTTGARPVEWLGFGILIGPAMMSLAMHLVPGSVEAGAWLGATVALGLAVLGFVLPSRERRSGRPGGVSNRWLWLLALVAGLLFIGQLGYLIQEVLWRPVYPWDAWSTWTFKAKAWFLAGERPDFVDPGVWPSVAETEASQMPVQAPHYPTLVAGYQVYLAAWLGEWREPLLNFPWLLVHLAIPLLVFGESLRLSGNRPMAALCAVLVASVPLVAVHTALAGYMDIWVATGLLALGLAVMRTQLRHAGDVLGVVLLGLVLVALKVEAVIWLAVMVATLLPRWETLVNRLPAGLRRFFSVPTLAVLGLLAVSVAAWAGLHVELPYLGTLAFGFNPQATSILSSLFVSWNWHLFFPALLVCLAIDAGTRSREPGVAGWRSLAIGGMAIVTALCLLVRVAGESTDITNYNRILLQWLPVWAMYGIAVITRFSEEKERN